MKLRRVLVCSLIGLVAMSAPQALAGVNEDAAKLFAEGKALVAKADFEGAQKAFAAAAKLDSEKKLEYRQQYSMLRQVMQMRESIDKEKNEQKWQAMARALRSYYHQNKVYSEALALDKKVHEKLKNGESAAALAGTQLAMGLNEDAAKVIGGLDEKSMTAEARILLGIALARQKKIDEAKAAVAKCKLAADSDSGLYYDMACVKALVGESDEANALLTRAFELTPPSRLDAVKAHAKTDKDLASLVGSAGFEKALKTESKVKESKCSGGSSCGNCPSRGGCSSAKGGSSCATETK